MMDEHSESDNLMGNDPSAGERQIQNALNTLNGFMYDKKKLPSIYHMYVPVYIKECEIFHN